ncbi:putative holin [Phytopseudomonas daroniae]|uniref:phage tail tube protein n=1 Tax=Phytopseudomonas daroniae TaxID=2487519 RepID=UPI001038423A|nr:putative holin [Pseudomonas daroniae]TBU73294.1 hypothetical protein DNK10_18695 [Pseudomonas daroniae]
MSEPSGVVIAGALGVSAAGLFAGVDGNAVTGAFCGALVFFMARPELGLVERLVYFGISLTMGYLFSPALSDFELWGFRPFTYSGPAAFAAAALVVTLSIAANRNVRSPVSDVQATIGMYDITAENVARVTRSTLSTVPTTAIVDEPLVCGGVEGELIPFKYLPDMSKTIALKAADDEALSPGEDYLLTPHGVIVTGSGNITAAGVKASYTPRAQTAVQMLNGSEGEFELYIAGLNDAQSGEPFSLRPRRMKFGTIAQLPVFGTEYLKLEAPAELLADPLVLNNDISKFCEMQIVDKAA